MRFPNDAVPPAKPATEPTEIGEPAAVSPVRPIRTGIRGAFIEPRARQGSAEGELSRFAERQGEDRRKVSRRLHQVPVMLDTRGGRDRRKDARRDGDVLSHLDKEV